MAILKLSTQPETTFFQPLDPLGLQTAWCKAQLHSSDTISLELAISMLRKSLWISCFCLDGIMGPLEPSGYQFHQPKRNLLSALHLSSLHHEAPWICTPPKKIDVDTPKNLGYWTRISAMGKKNMPHARHYPPKKADRPSLSFVHCVRWCLGEFFIIGFSVQVRTVLCLGT